jgi:predicted ester cyclase
MKLLDGRWLLMALLVVTANAQPAEGTEMNQTRMKQVVSDLFEVVWNKAEFSGVDQMWSAEVAFHFRGSTSKVDAQGLQSIVTLWRTAFPDFMFTVHQIIADGDTVAARVSFAGTQSGSFGELEPTGRRVEVSEMMFFRFADDKAIEAWEDFDEFGMRQQLGAS